MYSIAPVVYADDNTKCPQCHRAPTKYRDCPECTDGILSHYQSLIYMAGESLHTCSVCRGTGIEQYCPHCDINFSGIKKSSHESV